jgi:hypothetical protein
MIDQFRRPVFFFSDPASGTASSLLIGTSEATRQLSSALKTGAALTSCEKTEYRNSADESGLASCSSFLLSRYRPAELVLHDD